MLFTKILTPYYFALFLILILRDKKCWVIKENFYFDIKTFFLT